MKGLTLVIESTTQIGAYLHSILCYLFFLKHMTGHQQVLGELMQLSVCDIH